ncbi:hypothetical protein [Gracilibacillus xinjiangensis]|uniref:Uncharacterized protein n=1 Tax=Gracilibacillus xinjiangensis TaxID=1193282 RepID=A0ABV8WTW9_9BACI
MIPLELQEALKERMGKEFKDLLLKNVKNEEVPINIFTQHLPAKDKNNKNNTDPYPCIIVRLSDGEQADNNESGNTSIQFIVGVVDRENTFQGYRDAITVANRIIENVKRNSLVEERYELEMPITWAYHDEDSEPYFFAGVQTNWSTPKHIREDVEDMI